MQKVINRQNLLFNFDVVLKKAKGKKICVIVKSDGYGSDMAMVVKTLKNKASFFAVATFDEALKVREHTKKPILILNKVEKSKLIELSKLNISISVGSLEELKAIIKTKAKIKVHIAINTGMNRFGVKTIKKFKQMLFLISSFNLKLEGIYTHLYNGKDKQSSNKQINRFKKFLNTKNAECQQLINKSIKHALATEGLFNNCKLFDMVRVGLAIYGYGSPVLKPVLSIYAKVVAKQKLKAGEVAGYSAIFTAQKTTNIAVLNIGYASGVLRSYVGFYVLINGQKAKIVAVCMNVIIVDITTIKNVRLNTKAVIMGENKDKITANDIAAHTGTINYEILTNFK